MKKILAILLALSMLLALAVPTVAVYDEAVEVGLYVGTPDNGGWAAAATVTVSEEGAYTLVYDGDEIDLSWIIVKNTAGETAATSIPEGTAIVITELVIDGTTYTFDGGNSTYTDAVGANGTFEVVPYLTPNFGGTDHIDDNPLVASNIEITFTVGSDSIDPGDGDDEGDDNNTVSVTDTFTVTYDATFEESDWNSAATIVAGTLVGANAGGREGLVDLLPAILEVADADAITEVVISVTTSDNSTWQREEERPGGVAGSDVTPGATVYVNSDWTGLADDWYLADGATFTITEESAGVAFGAMTKLQLCAFGCNPKAEEAITVTLTISVTYESAIPTYTVTVTKGTADVAEAKEGDTVTVTADAAPYGKQFIGWTAEGVTLEDATLTEVSFTMPANNVTLTANYEDIPEEPDVPTEKVLWTYAGDVELPYTVVGANWCAEKDSYDGKTADWNAYYAASIAEGAELVITTTHTRWFNIFFGNVWNSEPANDLSFWFMLGDYDTVTYNEDGSATHVIDLPAAFAGWEAKATEEGKNFDPDTYKSKMMLNFQVPGEETNVETGEVTPAGELTITEMYIKAPAYKVSLYTPESEGVEVGTYAVGQTVSITAPAKEGMVFAGWNVLKGDIELNNANAATTTFKMPASNVVVEPTYEEESGNVRIPGHITSGGYVIMGDEYHALIGNGIIITTPHVFDANNVCIYCGHYVEPVADESEIVVEVTDPVEPSTEEEEDVTVEVEEPAEDTNPTTGLALAVVPMLIAAAAVVISKR